MQAFPLLRFRGRQRLFVRPRRLLAFAVGACLAGAMSSAPVARAHGRSPPPSPEELAWTHYATLIRTAAAAKASQRPTLPAPPAGVTDLDWRDFFGPIGDGGLEYSATVQALAGQRVRLAGYMVKQRVRPGDLFLFTALPFATDEIEDAHCDELPPATVHVIVTPTPGKPVPLTPGLLVLTGRLEIGPRPEADGRNSVVRLFLDPPAAPVPAGSSTSSVSPVSPTASTTASTVSAGMNVGAVSR